MNRIFLLCGVFALVNACCEETGYMVPGLIGKRSVEANSLGTGVGVYSFSGTTALPPPFDVLTVTLQGCGVVVSPDGRTLYVLNTTDGAIWTLPSDGSVLESLFANVPLGGKLHSSALAISPDGKFLYVLTNDANVPEVYIYSVEVANPNAGAIELIHDTTFGLGDITISTDGATGYVLDTSNALLYSFSTTTQGSLTLIPVSSASPTVKDRGLSDPVGWIDTIDDTHLIMTQGGEEVYKVTLSGNTGVRTIILTQSGALFCAVAVTPDKTAALLLDVEQSKNGIYRISLSDQSFTPVFLCNGFFPNSSNADIAVGLSVTPSPPGPPASGLFPPSNVRGVSHEIGSLDSTVFYNQLDWEAPLEGTIPRSGYQIYRNGLLMVELPVETYTWQDPLTPQGEMRVTYSLVSVSSTGLSAPVFITITKEKNG